MFSVSRTIIVRIRGRQRGGPKDRALQLKLKKLNGFFDLPTLLFLKRAECFTIVIKHLDSRIYGVRGFVFE